MSNGNERGLSESTIAEELYSPFAKTEPLGGNEAEGYTEPAAELPQENSESEEATTARPPTPELEAEDLEVPRTGPAYVRWAQKALTKVLGSGIPLSGTLDASTKEAIRKIQSRFNLPKTGAIDARTRHLLALAAIPKRKSEVLGESEEEYTTDSESETAAAVGTAFDIIRSTITSAKAGDVKFEGPNNTIGVRWPGKPKLTYNLSRDSRLIVDFRETHPIFGYEFANVKLRCKLQFNGPEIEVTFTFEPDGKRSRLQTDTVLTIQNPLLLETKPTPLSWQKLGIPEYPVIRIPVEFRVDRMWPWSNYNENFELALSGMYGFGVSEDRCYIVERRTCWDGDCANRDPVCRKEEPRVRIG